MNELYYTKEELLSLGVRTVGDNCMVSRKCSIYCGGYRTRK